MVASLTSLDLTFLPWLNVAFSTFEIILELYFVSSARVFGILTKNVMKNTEKCGSEYSGNLHWIELLLC